MNRITRPYLGELELTVLEELWAHGPKDAKTMHSAIGVKRGITLNTVQSALERLFRKQLLEREKVSHAYVYSSAVAREALMERLIANVIETLSEGRPEPMLTAFVDLASRADEDNLSKLEQLITERRSRKKGKSQ